MVMHVPRRLLRRIALGIHKQGNKTCTKESNNITLQMAIAQCFQHVFITLGLKPRHLGLWNRSPSQLC